MELKRKPYIVSLRERVAEAAITDAVTHKHRLQRQISEHHVLIDSLKARIDGEDLAEQNGDKPKGDSLESGENKQNSDIVSHLADESQAKITIGDTAEDR